jgi:mersacidin/lichenicidin family type 2 lantibiotic
MMSEMLSNEMIVRAWKDPKFRAQLGGSVPGSPAGSAQLVASEISGEAYWTSPVCTDAGPRCEL